MAPRSTTHQRLGPAHALPEEDQPIVGLEAALELGAVRGVPDVAAGHVPLRHLPRSPVGVDQAGLGDVVLAGEDGLEVAVEVVHPVDQADLVEVDPAGHELIAEGHQGRFVAEHELPRGHPDQGVGVGLADDDVQAEAGDERGVFHYVGDALEGKAERSLWCVCMDVRRRVRGSNPL